jgi:hypothetical protein
LNTQGVENGAAHKTQVQKSPEKPGLIKDLCGKWRENYIGRC